MHIPWHNLIILTVVALFYGRIINYLLVVDDLTQFELMKNGQKCDLKTAGFVRWIKYKLYGFGGVFGVDFTNAQTQRRSIQLDHALTLGLHALICCLIYEVLGHNDISFWAAILYAVNPINHQTAIWSNGRRYTINIIMVLAMIALPKPWGLLAWVCTPFLHLTAVFAPVMLGWKYALAIPIAGAIAYYWQYRDYQMRMGTQKSDEMLNWKPTRLIPSVKLFGFYFVRSFWPGRVMMVYPHLYFWGLTKDGNKDAHHINAKFARGVIAMLLSVVGLICLHGQERLYLVFSILSIVQWCGWLMCTQHSCDRYTSCATPFMMYLASYLSFTYLGHFALPVILFLTGLYIAELNVVMPMYKSIISFHEFHNHYYKDNIISRSSMVHGMMGEKQPMQAWYHIVESLKYHPHDMRMNLLAAEICLCMADKNGAQAHLSIAVNNCYEGQYECQLPAFQDLQRRINAPTVFPNEPRPKNKYDGAGNKKEMALV
jgi:hypothetical protein